MDNEFAMKKYRDAITDANDPASEGSTGPLSFGIYQPGDQWPTRNPDDLIVRGGTVDVRSLIDDNGCNFSADTFKQACYKEATEQALCYRLSTDVAPFKLSGRTMWIVRDLQRGLRTKQRLHMLADTVQQQGCLVQESFSGIDISTNPLLAGRQWAVTAFTTDPNFLSLGSVLQITRYPTNASKVRVSISNDPAYVLNGRRPYPPASFQRGDVSIRGRLKGSQVSIQLMVDEATGSVALPWAYRPPSANLDTAQVDIAVAAPNPNLTTAPFDYMQTANIPAQASVFSFLVETSIPVQGITLYPLANNNPALAVVLPYLLAE